MSAWPGKYVIGLTGNIATGKSVVRRMLEDLGASGIDADALARTAINKGSPGYIKTLETFGAGILTLEGEIDRARLGQIVFSDAESLEELEAIIHPIVSQMIDKIISESPENVFIIEAIKLIEAGLAKKCDQVWVTISTYQKQIARLVQDRAMSEEMANHRIQAQGSQQVKVRLADIVIDNNGSLEGTWRQVKSNWQDIRALD